MASDFDMAKICRMKFRINVVMLQNPCGIEQMYEVLSRVFAFAEVPRYGRDFLDEGSSLIPVVVGLAEPAP